MPSDPDDLEVLLGDGHAARREDQEGKTLLRVLVGRPRIWLSAFWCVIGLAWLVLALLEPAVWRLVLGTAWLVLGLVMVIVAFIDRRNNRGTTTSAHVSRMNTFLSNRRSGDRRARADFNHRVTLKRSAAEMSHRAADAVDDRPLSATSVRLKGDCTFNGVTPILECIAK